MFLGSCCFDNPSVQERGMVICKADTPRAGRILRSSVTARETVRTSRYIASRGDGAARQIQQSARLRARSAGRSLAQLIEAG